MKHLPILFFLIGIIFSLSAHAQGFRIIEKQDLQIGVWYPSDSPLSAGHLGAIEVKYAFEGDVKPGKHPVVLMSHGNGGHFSSHHLSSAALARSGYIVIAPFHSQDRELVGRKTAKAIQIRSRELRQALELVQNEADFADALDKSRIHGFGYSLGTITVMLAKGAVFDLRQLAAHCRTNGEEDASFCRHGNLWKRLMRLARHFFNRDKTPLRQSADAIINGSVALVAPVGKGIEIPNGFNGDFLIIGIDADEIVPMRFHAQFLAESLQGHANVREIVHSGHHFAFLGPFPQSLIDKEKSPVMLDPAGFDRRAFIDAVNKDIAGFLGKAD